MALPRPLVLIRALLFGVFLTLVVVAPPRVATAQGDGLVRPGKRRGGGKVRRPPRGGKRRTPRVRRPRPAKQPEPVDDSTRNQMLIDRYHGVLESQPGEQFALTRLMELYRQEHGTLAPLLERYEREVEENDDAYAARMILGELYRRGGRAEEGMTFLREAAELRPGDPAPRLALARAAEELGQAETVRSALEESLSLSRGQDRQEVLRRLRDVVLEQGDLESARDFHAQLIRATASSLYVRLELGQALARNDRHREAVEEFERVLRQVRGDPRARVPVLRAMAQSQIAAGDEDEALETLESAMRLTQPGSGQRAELLELMVDVYRRRDALRELVDLLEDERGGGFERAELLARLCDELALSERAERWYQTALRANPRHVDTRARYIRLLIRQGRIEEATREYETLVRHAPREPRFVTELAEMYLRIGQRDRALELLARTSRTNPNDAAIHSALLDLYSGLGEEDLALEEARILTRIDPRDDRHLVDLGERYYQAGDRERALSTWRRIPSVVAERWRGLAVLGDVYADHEMNQEAIELYEEALRIEPGEVSVLRRMANLMERLHRWDEAIANWQRVIDAADAQDTGSRREARSRIVTIWSNQRQLHRQIPRLRQQFSAPTPDVESGRFLYEALERLGRLGEATEVMRQVIEQRPGDVEARLSLERVLVRRGELAEAMEVLRALLELEPRRSREFYQRLASYSMQLQRDDEALEFAARALALNPDDAQGHYRLAQLYRQQGNPARAVVEYRRALDLNDRLYDAYLELADLHETRSETQEAIRVYLRLLSKSPDDALVARAGRQALLLSVMDGTVAQLEHDLLPLALAHTERVVYRRVLVALYGNLTWSLIQTAAYDQPEAAAEARARLEEIGQRSLQPLLDALLDADPDQQEAAVSMLGHLGNPSAAVPLVAFATGEGSPSLRARALVAAGQVGDERVVPSLSEILDGGGSVAMREAAAFGLGQIATGPAIERLRSHLENPVASIRALACIGLGYSGEARHLEPVVERLRTDDSPLAAAAAAWALGFIESEESTVHLIRALRSGSLLVRRAAAWSLGARDDHRARRELASALFDESLELRSVAAWALRRVGSGALEPEAGHAYHRMSAGQLRISSYLADLLRYDLEEGSALAALTRASDQLRTALDHALGGRGRPRRERVVVALRALESPAPGRLLLSPLVHTDELDREGVEAALEPLIEVAVERAEALLSHRDPELRSLAVGVLGAAGTEQTVDGLLRALDDEEPSVRHLATEHLARLGEQRAIAPLGERLETDRWSERARVVRALGELPSPEAVALLEGVLRQDPSSAVRAEAAVALTRQEAVGREALLRVLGSDRDAEAQSAACQALRRLATGDVFELPTVCATGGVQQ